MNRSMDRVPLALAVLFLAAAFGVRAEQGPPKPKAEVTPNPASTQTSSFTVELQQVRVRFEADGKGSREFTSRVRVHDALGVRQWGQLTLSYAPITEKLEIVSIAVEKPDGRTIPVGAEAVQDLDVRIAAELPVFMDLRQKHVTVPSLQQGDLLSVVAKWTIIEPLAPGHSWFEYSFGKNAIIKHETLELDVPANLEVIVSTREKSPAEQAGGGKGQLTSDRRIYRWQTANLSIEPEDARTMLDEPAPADVRMTTFQSWNELGEWLGPLMAPRPDDSVRAKALELTSNLTDRRARIDALYKFVSSEIRYVSLSFGIGRFAPHPPAEVLGNRYGDCKDKHTLLASMLAAINVEASPVLMRNGRSVSDNVPSPSEFDHVITFVPDGEGLWLDSTPEIAPPGLLVPTLRDKRGLILRKKNSNLVTTPADGPFPFKDSTEITGAVNPLGVLTARVRMRLRGDSELVLREALRQLPKEKVQEFVEGYAPIVGLKGTISDASVTNLTSTDSPLELLFTVRTQGFLDWAAASSSVGPSAGDALLSSLEITTAPKKDAKLGSPTLMHYRTVIELPKGYSATAPLGIKVARQGFRYESTYQVRDQQLIVERSLQRDARLIPAAQWQDVSAFGRSLKADVEQKFAVRGSVLTTPEVTADMTAAELYAGAYSAYEAKKYEVALGLWQKTVALDPKMSDAWNGIGSCHKELGRFAEAAAAYEHQIALDPSNKTAHSDLGSALDKNGKLDEAAKAYAKHLDLNPLDAEAHRALGLIYNDLENTGETLRTLERAAQLSAKKDPWLQVILGKAYLDLKQTEKARTAFSRADAEGATSAEWTKTAWELAAHNVDNDNAIELAGRSLKSLADATSAISIATVVDSQFEAIEGIAWSWAATGIARLNKGDSPGAIRFLRAAWLLDARSETAGYLGQAYEKVGRTSDALSTYLVGAALERTPPPDILGHIRRMTGGADVQRLIAVAPAQLFADSSITVKDELPPGKARFMVVVDRDRRPLQIKMVDGDASMKALEGTLRLQQLPVEFPDDVPVQLVVGVYGQCIPTRGCTFALMPVSRMKQPH